MGIGQVTLGAATGRTAPPQGPYVPMTPSAPGYSDFLARFQAGGQGGGPGGGGVPAVDPMQAVMDEQIAATTTQLQSAYQKLYADLYGQLGTENASEKYQMFQSQTAEEQALQQLQSDFASRGMTRSGAYMQEQAKTLEQMQAQRAAILGQYAAAHAAISARLGMAEDRSNLVKNETTGMMEVREIDPATGQMTDKVLATQDPSTGVWTLSEGSGLYAEWQAEQAAKEAEIRRQYALAGLPNS
jgi:hypothetical protein